MNIIRELKKTIYYHMMAGISLSVMLCVLLMAAKYKYSLMKATADLGSIRINVLKMEHVVKVMREKQSVAVNILPEDYNSRSHREIVLLALERMRSSITGADVIVGNFLEENGKLTLPVTLEFKAHQYNEGLNVIGHLQELRFPDFKTQNVIAKRNEETHEIVWRIGGLLRMPAERVIMTADGRDAK